jgi:hypothetical protein
MGALCWEAEVGSSCIGKSGGGRRELFMDLIGSDLGT